MNASGRTGIIKEVVATFPKERPISSRQLRQAGVSNELARIYVKSGWLQRFERGTFGFKGAELNLQGSLEFLAERHPGLHVGGKTALSWRGALHNIPFQETLSLWGPRNVRIPAWFQERFPCRYTSRQLFEEELPSSAGISTIPTKHGTVPISEPERAILELLSEVGTHQEIDEARHTLELLGSLRIESLLPLLTHCRQIKSARLCIQWAAELGLPWAVQAGETLRGVTGGSRWVRKLANGTTLILNGS